MHIIAFFFFLTRGYRTESLLHLVITSARRAIGSQKKCLQSELTIGSARLKILKTSFEFGSNPKPLVLEFTSHRSAQPATCCC
jgi:hypothetical protein